MILLTFAMALIQTRHPVGKLTILNLASAPYPHVSREKGYTRNGQTYGPEHYQSSEVAVYIPSGFKTSPSVNFVVHFHGHNNHIPQVLEQFDLQNQMEMSQRNAILVVPQGPRDVPDSGFGKLELEKNGLENLLKEVLISLSKISDVPKSASIGNITLTSHSGGYKVTSAILGRKELPYKVRDVLLFDSSYGGLENFADWVASNPRDHRLISICTEHLGHANAELIAFLQERKVQATVKIDSAIQDKDIAKRGCLIILTETLEHNEVVSKRNYFSNWLSFSKLPQK